MQNIVRVRGIDYASLTSDQKRIYDQMQAEITRSFEDRIYRHDSFTRQLHDHQKPHAERLLAILQRPKAISALLF